MKRYSFFLLLLTALVGVTLVMPGCKREKSAKKMSPVMRDYVYAYTAGNISKNDAVRVQFVSAVIKPEQVGTDASHLINISPSVKGKAVWESVNTIRFEPTTPMPSGTKFVASVNTGKLFDKLPSEARTFEFEFRTKVQSFEFDWGGLQTPALNNAQQQQYVGTLYTADMAIAEEIEPILSATFDGKKLPIRWTHGEDGLAHQFAIGDIVRGTKSADLVIKWNGAGLNPNKRGEKTLRLPEAGKFTLLEAQVMQGEEQYALLNFTDPVQPGQELEGLIRLEGIESPRFIIDGNNVRVYPTQAITGTKKLQLEAAIRSSANTQLSNTATWSLTFEDVKPAVRLLGNGVILPNNESLVFPFEAVNLSHVDIEVFKIYNNNILQFLQTNALDGQYEMERVGNIIWQERVALDRLHTKANKAAWTRYGVDISKVVQKDPNAFYQVRIGIRKEYSLYPCGNAPSTTLPPFEERKDEDGNYISVMGYADFYSDADYNSVDRYGEGGYNWEQRDMPCEGEYFNPERNIYRNVIASNLGITAKLGKDNTAFVAVTDILTTNSLSGVKIEFYDYQQQVVGSGTTGNDGTVTVTLSRKPFFCVGSTAQQKGYVRMEDGEALQLSRYDVSGEVVQKGIKGFIYGERGVWRPGDSLYLNFVLEDKSRQLPENYPITFELADPKGRIYYKTATARHVNNIYPLPVATSAASPTGNWLAKVKVGGATFTKQLKIETVKPNRLKLDLNFGGRKELSAADGGLGSTLQVNWLHGAPAANLKAKVEISAKAVLTDFPNYKSAIWTFNDPARSFEPEPQTIFDGALDANGAARINSQVGQSAQAPGKLQINYRVRAFEQGGDFSTDNFSMTYHPFSGYTGVRLPQNRYGEKRLEMEKKNTLEFVAVDKNGNPRPNATLTVGYYKVEWRWWWDVGYDNISQYNATNMLGAIETKTLRTDGKGIAQWTITPDDWGRYLVRVCDENTGHCAGDFFYAGYPWYDEQSNGSITREQRRYAAMLSFAASKTDYKVNEEIVLQIPSSEQSRALITVENGTKVTQHFWADFKKGDNTFRFKATPEMAPIVYVHASLLQPHGQTTNDLPIRMYGILPIKIDNPDTRLAPVLQVANELKPEQKFEVEVSEKSGRAMAYTVAIVDDGLLDLTRFKTPNPWDAFYAREALGVKTWDVYDFVLGAYGAALERILGIGGDGINTKAKNAEKANRFKPVVLHAGPFYLKKGEKAAHKFTMPNYVGSVRVMVVAADKPAYGNAEKTVPVRKALMTLATLPRVLSPGESLQLPVNVFAMKENVKDVKVSVSESSGLIDIVGNKSQQLAFAKVGDAMTYFDLKVPNKTGIAKFKITATGGGETTTQDIEIEIRNPNPVVSRVVEKVLQPNESWNATYAAAGVEGTNTAILEVSSIPPINLGERLRWLIQYPHGCVEQMTSAAFPQLYLDKLVKLDDKRKKQTTDNVNAALQRLRDYQTPDGGFGYWIGAQDADNWSSSYVGHFFIEAQNAGYTLPTGALDKWLKYQKKKASEWQYRKKADYEFNANDLAQAYRLFTLALAKQPDMAAMNRLRETPELSLTAKWRLAAAYALAGKIEIGNQLIKSLHTDVPAYRELSYTYGSHYRDESMILEALLYLKDMTRATAVAKNVSARLSSQDWYSTQETAYGLLAMAKFATLNGLQNRFTFTYQQSGKTVNAGADNPLMQISLAPNGNQAVALTNTSKGVLYARIITTGQPAVGDTATTRAYANDLRLEVNYTTLKGEAVNLDNLPQGKDILMKVTVTHPGTRNLRYEEMALQTVFPAGWEIANNRMTGVGYGTNSPYDYQDVRDDRIYTYFGLNPGQSVTYTYMLTASYAGRYYLPPVACEAMYDNTITARKAGRWVTVTKN